MSKDKVFGFIIMIVGLLLMIVYTLWGPLSLYWINNPPRPEWLDWLYNTPGFNWQWAVVLPLWLIIVLIGLIAIWIGYSMLTTPPPVPLEELEEELEKEEAASATEEKKANTQ